jgi:outer membrane protein assembly factor BamB
MTRRDEPPSWSTPTVVTAGRAELVVNGADYVRGYDPQTGEERWRLASGSPMATPTPFAAGGLSFVASGGLGSPRPVAAIRSGASGDLTPTESKDAPASLAWQLTGRGPFLATPLAYRELLYVLGNNGVLDAYEVTSGKEVYRGRVPEIGSGFSASPVAADGRIYLANEDGSVIVVAAGREFRHIATNEMGEPVMATPALSRGVMYVRGAKSVFAIGTKPAADR